MQIQITIEGEPSRATHQASLRVIRTKSGKSFVGKYASSGAKKNAQSLAEAFKPYKPAKPLDGALLVNLTWVFGYPKSTPKSKMPNTSWKTTRPDLDNLEKTILDVLTQEGFMHDDSQVAFKVSKKLLGLEPKLYIGINTLDTSAIMSSLQQ